MEGNTYQVSATVDEVLYKELTKRAEFEERTKGVIIRRALRAYLLDEPSRPEE